MLKRVTHVEYSEGKDIVDKSFFLIKWGKHSRVKSFAGSDNLKV